MENSNQDPIKKTRVKRNLPLPDNYNDLDPIEKRRAYQRLYCKSRYVSRKGLSQRVPGTARNINPDVKLGRKPKENPLYKDKEYVKEYNKKYYAEHKERLDAINKECQKRIRDLKKAEKLIASGSSTPKLEPETPNQEPNGPATESNDDYVITNVYMLLQLNKK